MIINFLTGLSSVINVTQTSFTGHLNQEIYGDITVGQSFLSPNNGLNAVSILFGTYGRDNNGNLTFHLRTDPSSSDIVTIVVNTSKIPDNNYYTFKFFPINNSSGKSYFFFVDSHDSSPGNAVTLYFDSRDSYQQGTMYINGKPVIGHLSFKAYNEFSTEVFLSNVIRDAMKQIGFFTFYLIIILLTVTLLVIVGKRRYTETPK